MEELEVYFPLVMLSECKNATETAQKISSVYSQGAMTDCPVWNWFYEFHFGNTSLRDEPRPGPSLDFDQDAFRELVDCNIHESTLELALDFNTTNLQYIELARYLASFS